ncbi:hypothetical protein QQ045_031868 [Rhodiola kirilowii]
MQVATDDMAVDEPLQKQCLAVKKTDIIPSVKSTNASTAFWLSKDAEIDLFDIITVLDRKDSTKINNSNSPPSHLSNANSKSQRESEYQPSEMASVTDGEHLPSVPLDELIGDLHISDEEYDATEDVIKE